jgi:hypothetical protein
MHQHACKPRLTWRPLRQNAIHTFVKGFTRKVDPRRIFCFCRYEVLIIAGTFQIEVFGEARTRNPVNWECYPCQ